MKTTIAERLKLARERSEVVRALVASPLVPWLLVLPVLVGWAWHRLGQGAYPAGPPTPPDAAGGAETGASS